MTGQPETAAGLRERIDRLSRLTPTYPGEREVIARALTALRTRLAAIDQPGPEQAGTQKGTTP